MKNIELQGKTIDQLKEILANLKKESLNLRFQKTSGELENVSRIKQVRRATARVKTMIFANAKLMTGGNNA